jgi:microcystin-dependent protein
MSKSNAARESKENATFKSAERKEHSHELLAQNLPDTTETVISKTSQILVSSTERCGRVVSTPVPYSNLGLGDRLC